MDERDSQVDRILDRFVRKRIDEILYDNPTYFRGKLKITDILPHIKLIVGVSSYEKLERERDRGGNARSIDELLDVMPRHSGFGLRFLRALVDARHEDVAERIMEGFNRQLPSTRRYDFLGSILPRPPPPPPPYSPPSGSGIREDQQEKWNNLRSPSSGPLSHLPTESGASVSTEQSHILSSSNFSEETNGPNDLQLNIQSSTHSRQATDITSTTASGGGNSQASSAATNQVPTRGPEDRNLSCNNPTVSNNMPESRYDAINSDDRIAVPVGDENSFPQRQQMDATLATVAEGTTNYPPSPAGVKDEEAAARSASHPTSDVQSLCVSSTLTIDAALRGMHASETIPKDVGYGNNPSSSDVRRPQNAVNDLSQEDIPSECLCISASPSPYGAAVEGRVGGMDNVAAEEDRTGRIESGTSGTSQCAERVNAHSDGGFTIEHRSLEQVGLSSNDQPEVNSVQQGRRSEKAAETEISSKCNTNERQMVDQASESNASEKTLDQKAASSTKPLDTSPDEKSSKEQFAEENLPPNKSKLDQDAPGDLHPITSESERDSHLVTVESVAHEEEETHGEPGPAAHAQSKPKPDATTRATSAGVLETGLESGTGDAGLTHGNPTTSNEAPESNLGSGLIPVVRSTVSQSIEGEKLGAMNTGDVRVRSHMVPQVEELRGGNLGNCVDSDVKNHSENCLGKIASSDDWVTNRPWTLVIAVLAFAQIAALILRRKFSV